MKAPENTIQRRLVRIVLTVTAISLLLVSGTFLAYELGNFKQNTMQQARTLGEIVASNSTAAVAFDSPEEGREILSALRAEQSVVSAVLYDRHGEIFTWYPETLSRENIPAHPREDGYVAAGPDLSGFEPVIQEGARKGTLYLQWDLRAAYSRFWFYGGSIIVMMTVCFLATAYSLSRTLRRMISVPIQSLAATAKAVSDRADYSVRAATDAEGELGLLTNVFNHMLQRIEGQNAAVRESEQRVRSVVNSAMTAVIVIDGDGKIKDWNPRAESMFGWTAAEAAGRDLGSLIVPPMLREAHRRGMERFFKTKRSPILNRIIEMSALRKDGTEFPVELSIGVMASGGAMEFCGFVTDITERKQTEIRIQTQLSRLELLERITRATADRQDLQSIFRVVLANLEDNLALEFACFCLCDPSGNTLTMAAIGNKGRSVAEATGLQERSQIPAVESGLTRCIRGHLIYEPDIESTGIVFLKRLADAGLRSLVAAPLPVENKVSGILLAGRGFEGGFSSADCEFIRQLSEHVALAAHQANLYGALQGAYEDLRQTQQAVLQQERLRALGQMASGIAHDINNAISPIALYTETLLENEPNLSSRARDYLSITQRSIEDVAQTIARMREFYRQRESQLELAPVDLNALIAQVRELTRARWSDMPQEHGISIELRTDLAERLPPLMGVETELREALVNLIFNAVDAMPEGGRITMRTFLRPAGAAASTGARDAICMEVTDTGTGMSEEAKRRCLEPFFTTKGERGTGLGLPMVYGIAQRHSAEIEIDSTPGIGTTIRLALPVTVPVAAAPVRPSAPAPARQLSVLVVDDDPLLIRALRETLENDGHVVTTATGGQAGIDAFTAAHRSGRLFHAVITDLGMPYVDGRKVAATIKQVSARTPIIMLTGWGQRLVADRDIPDDVDRVLNKPPKLNDLRTALAELTGGEFQAAG